MADTHNIYQRAIDIFNKHVEPDISQGGGGGGGPKYMHKIAIQALLSGDYHFKFGKETSDRKKCKLLVSLNFMVELPVEQQYNTFDSLYYLLDAGYIKNAVVGLVAVYDADDMETKLTDFPVFGVSSTYNDGERIAFYYPYFDWDKGQISYSYNEILSNYQMQITDIVEEIV